MSHHQAFELDTKISPGSKILVTGAAGLIGSAVVHQLLAKGFGVRATTRTASKLVQLKKKVDEEFGSGCLEVVEIKDLSIEGALDGSLNGASGLINVASDMAFTDDIGLVESVKSLTKGVLNSAQAAGSVKSFVFTSSRVAAFGEGSADTTYSDKDWFNKVFDLAKIAADDAQKRGLIFLKDCASKVAGEKALWEFKEKENPSFRISTILPDLCVGRCHNPAEGHYSTHTALVQFSRGEPGLMDHFIKSPCWYCNVDDVAKLHVAALLDTTVDGQRLWAAAGPYSAEDVQKVLKEVKPDYKEKDLSSFLGPTKFKIENKASVDLLQKHYGHGFTSLKEAVRANVC